MEDKYILTSDNNEKYLVISRTVYNGITYCWIGKLDDSSEYFFGKIVNDEVEIVDDPELIKILTPLLVNNHNLQSALNFLYPFPKFCSLSLI